MTPPPSTPAPHAGAQHASAFAPARVQPTAMRSTLTRTIVLGVVACAAWYTIVRPLEQRARSAQSEASDLAQRAAVSANRPGAAPTDDASARLDEFVRAARELEAWASPGTTDQVLFDELNRLASERGLTVERMDPTPPRTVQPQAVRGRRTAPSYTAQARGFRLQLRGTYDALARFADDIESDMGASRVTALRIASPAAPSREGEVEALLETQHIQLLPAAPDASAPRSASAGGAS